MTGRMMAIMPEHLRMWTLAASTLERDLLVHGMTEDEQRVMIGAVLNAQERIEAAERPAMTDWQLIETAPKDGTDILLFEMLPHEPFYRVGYWDEDGENVHTGKPEAGWSDEGYTDCINPTHWMPLPEPPTAMQQVSERKRARLADFLNAFKADPFSTGADKVDRLLEVLAELEAKDNSLSQDEAGLFPPLEPGVAKELDRLNALVREQGDELTELRAALVRSPDTPISDDVRALLDKVRPMFPITTNMTPDYAEVYFGNGEGHSSQAMTMNPEHWESLNSLIAALSIGRVSVEGDGELREAMAALHAQGDGGSVDGD